MDQSKSSLVLVLVLCVVIPSTHSKLDVRSFSLSPDSPPLHSVTCNPFTGMIYIGGRNVLLQLDSNLTLIHKLNNGPIRDSLTCDPNQECPDGILEPNDYKIVEISKRKDLLLACGTSKQGTCSFHSLTNIGTSTPIKGPVPDKLLGSNKSCMVYLSPDTSSEVNEIVYAFQEYDGRAEEYSPLVMSMRKFVLDKTDHELRYYQNDPILNQFSGLDIHPELRANYYMSFVATFKWGGFLYFVMNTQKDLKKSNVVQMKLGRVCYGPKKDVLFRSYIDIELRCSSPDDSTDVYNKATAAVLVGDHLFITAVQLKHGFRQDIDQAQGTMLCRTGMQRINEQFAAGYYDCYQGEAYRLDWNRGEESKCAKTNIDTDVFDSVFKHTYCGEKEENTGISCGHNEDMKPLLKMNSVVKALKPVMATDPGRLLVLGMGDMDGNFHKVEVKDLDSKNDDIKARLFLTYKLSPKPIGADMEITEDGDAIVLAGDRVYTFPASSCGLHEDCDTCLRSNDPIGCGWCGNACTTEDQCKKDWVSMTNPDTASCPPSLYSISPLSGPTSGGTLLTLKGKNFGVGNDTHEIRIGDVNCEKKTVVDSELVCITRSSSRVLSAWVDIRVTSHSRHGRNYQISGQVHSDEEFHFKVPTLSSFAPNRGPRSGGTILTLQGDNLDIGSSIDVTVDDKYQCHIITNSSTELKCKMERWTSLISRSRRFALRSQASGPVQVKIDSATVMAERNGEPVQFYYLPDPVIGKVSPGRSFVSGGIPISVSGTNLDASVNPIMRGMLGNDLGVSVNCASRQDGMLMVCPSLDVKKQLGTIERPPMVIHIYFEFDGNKIPADPLRADISSFQYYSDPVFQPFPKTVQEFDVNKDEIAFAGQNLHLGFGKDDIRVLVGGEPCNVTSIDELQLMCKPSYEGIKVGDGDKQSVKITVGNLVFSNTDIGYVEFVRHQVSEAVSVNIIVLIIVVALVLIAVIVLVFVMRRQRCGFFKPKFEQEGSVQYTANRDAHSGLIGPSSPRGLNLDNDYTDGGAYPYGAGAMSSHKAQIDEDTLHLIESENLLVDRECLTLANEIGKGNFGCVRRGFLTLPDQKGDILVAVKTLHDNPRDIQFELQSFLQEALRMKDFNHPNVLTLIGVCLETDSMPLVVLPFMKHGDLLTYIKDENNLPTIKDLILYSIDIAKGMEYLSALKFVHRDLAARNCMLDEELHVRVADFGLARDIYERDYYCSDNKKAKLPVKWMAIESLEKGTYSAKSDVWSFGIVLWELMTRGAMPYPEVDNWDITRYLKAGRRMPHPQFCPDPLYEIMTHCWAANPADRPTFGQLAKDIRDMVESIMHQTGVSNRNIQTTYVNIGECNNYYYRDELGISEDRGAGSSPTTRSNNKTLATSSGPVTMRSDSDGGASAGGATAMPAAAAAKGMDEEAEEPTETTALRV